MEGHRSGPQREVLFAHAGGQGTTGTGTGKLASPFVRGGLVAGEGVEQCHDSCSSGAHCCPASAVAVAEGSRRRGAWPGVSFPFRSACPGEFSRGDESCRRTRG